MKFGNHILQYKEELLQYLNALMSLESVNGVKDDDCQKALEFMLRSIPNGAALVGLDQKVPFGIGEKRALRKV